MRAVMGGGRAEINFSSFLQAPPSAALCSSMTQPRRNVGSHGNSWVRCSDGCRGCYRGSASPGNALKTVHIFAAYLAGGEGGVFALCFVELRISERSAFRAPREPEGPACTWHGALQQKKLRQDSPKLHCFLFPSAVRKGLIPALLLVLL